MYSEESIRRILSVMSSCLCKNLEDAVSPVFIEAVEDRENNPIHAFDVHKENHRSRPSPDFDEAALDDVGGSQTAPQVLGKAVKAEQLRQIALQPLHYRRSEERRVGKE